MIGTAIAAAAALAASPASGVTVFEGTLGFSSGQAQIYLGEYTEKPFGSNRVEVFLNNPVKIEIEHYYVEFVYVYFLSSGELDYSNDFLYSFSDVSVAPMRTFAKGFTIPRGRTFISGDHRVETNVRSWGSSVKLFGQPQFGPINYLVTLAAVPEPTSWAMMILGVGMVGAALRRPGRVRSTGVRFGPVPAHA